MDCDYIPTLKYGDFSDRLHRMAAQQRIPINGTLEITGGCNFHCVHCYLGHANNAESIRKELSTAEVCGIIDQIVEAGCLWLLITGGDPLTRRDFKTIWEYAKRKGLILTLFTNGSLMTPAMADFLAEYRPFSIEITLYGASEATYQKVTGQKGMRARVLRGIELIMERKLPLKLKSFLMTHNVDELEEMRAYAEGLGLEFRYDMMMHGRMDGGGQPLGFQVPLEQVLEIELRDEKRMQARREIFPERFGKRGPGRNLFICGAGASSFHVNPYGELSMCELEREQVFNLRKGSFEQGWQQAIPQQRSRQYSDAFECAACDLRYLCFQCPAANSLAFNNPEKHSDFHCQFAHRMADYIRAVV